jgi:circadian clock protein KaiC
MRMKVVEADRQPLEKCPSGIPGLDEITNGGLPRGRPTLVCGSAGCGKTLFGMEFLVKGATEYGEPGVFMAFEETAEELTKNVRSLGFDLNDLAEQNLLAVDYVQIERSEIEETGEYDLEALFIRLGFAIDSIGARRVVIDTLEVLFSSLSDEGILRAELRRLFRWLKEKGVTAIITAERGNGALTRHGLEEYVSDCVILLDHRVTEQVSTRRLRIVKYRGSSHGSNEYPFLIHEGGVDVLPITSVGLDHEASRERVSTGLERLDAMLGGQGYYRGSSVLVSGTAGTGKSSVAAAFVDAACRRGERAIYFAFEEAQSQIIRNMQSIGIDLEPHLRRGLLRFRASRPTAEGLETHLATMYRMVRDFRPRVVVVDPITNFVSVGSSEQIKMMLMRLVDFLKAHQVTGLFTSLTHGHGAVEATDTAISSLIDTWLLLRDNEVNGERNRVLYVLKARGTPHSNQVREFLITSGGIELIDVYVGADRVLTGSARVAQEAQERAATLVREQEIERKRRDFERRRQAIEAQIIALRADLEAGEDELRQAAAEARGREDQLVQDQADMARRRRADRDGGEGALP